MRNNKVLKMASAVVLVNTDSDSQDIILGALRLVNGVEEVHALYGVYDFLIKIKAPTMDELKDITKFQIRQLSGVTSSLTLMVNEDNARDI
jgi:DNA-binding Lrp family transcriptional regulator